MEQIHKDIIGCYLYTITRHGYPPDASDSLQHMKEMKELGFRSIEMEGIRDLHLDGVYGMRHQIREKATSLGLTIPYFCVVLPGLSSPDRNERERNLKQFEKGCQLAASLGCVAVMDNSPLPPWKFPSGIPVARHYDEKVLAGATFPMRLKWKNYWNGIVETFRQACDIAAARNLKFNIHPCYGTLANTTDGFLLLAEAVKRDNLRFNMDTANQFFMKDNLFLSLLRLQDHVDYIHLSDSTTGKLEHLAIGKGQIRWERFLEMLNRISYRGVFGIDVGGAESAVPDLDGAYRSSAAWLTENWFRHLDEK